MTLSACLAVLFSFVCSDLTVAGENDGRLDIYFIDVEGGAATLFVTPLGESILIDSGYPDFGGRDRDRILDVVKNVAGLEKITHAAVTHWHLDHYGNHASLASEIEIEHFWDRGIPDDLQEDKKFLERIADYRAASQNESGTLRAGDEYRLEGKDFPLLIKIATASREVMDNAAGTPNPFAAEHVAKDDDPSDNAASVSFLIEFGHFRFLCCGDLTWNVEAKLMTPNNPLGKVDLFMVTHHGLPNSNNPVLVKAIDPVVAVMCNGHKKGGAPETIATLQACQSLQNLYQLHRNLSLEADAQTPAEFIANQEATEGCQGVWVKASVAPDGNSFAVQIGPDGKPHTYQCRAD